MIVEGYSGFIGTNIDQKFIDQIIDLNNSEEFKSGGITISHTKRPDKSFISKIKDFQKDKKEHFHISYKENIDNVFSSFVISKLKPEKDPEYFLVLTLDTKSDRGLIPTTQTTRTKESLLVDIIKSEVLTKRNASVYEKEKAKREREAWDRMERESRVQRDKAEREYHDRRNKEYAEINKISKEFEDKFTKQFFDDQFANACDLCDSHDIGAIKFGCDIVLHLNFKTKPLKYSHSFPTRSGGHQSWYDWFGKVDDKMADVISELATCSSRMEEYGFSCHYGFTDTGIKVVLKHPEHEKANQNFSNGYKPQFIYPNQWNR